MRRARTLPLALGLVLAAVVVAAVGAAPPPSTFTNAAQVTINDSASPPTLATPYPSDIAVSGLTGTLTQVTVTINDFRHHFPDDVDMLLVGPTGAKFVMWSDVGGITAIGCVDDPCTMSSTGVTITLDDAAASLLPDGTTLADGTFRPSDAGIAGQDNFPTACSGAACDTFGAAPSGAATFASTFNGTNPNGTWSLYVVDDVPGDAGKIVGGWALNFAGPTAVSIASFAARPARTGIALTWRTASETELAGFNVYRSGTGRTVRVNPRLIPAKRSGTTRGSTYRLVDRTARRGNSYTYRLEAVGVNGLRHARVFTTIVR
jgi:hypothetical protein